MDGYSLGQLKTFGLKTAIVALFDKLFLLNKTNPESALYRLLNTETSPWPEVKALWEQEQDNRTRKHLLKHAFLHTVMQQLELHCWQPAERQIAVFTQKEQVNSIATSSNKCSDLVQGIQL